jgi:GMP synthase-like glutamine amidotransferase
MKKKVYVIGNMKHYQRFIFDSELISTLKEADIVLFTGGEDITPSLYGKNKNYKTYNNRKRDELETSLFEAALKYNIPMLGICRGSQFLTTMAGGEIVQHVDGHGMSGTHDFVTQDGDIYPITSTHHQMMMPFNMNEDDFSVIASSLITLSGTYEGSNADEQYEMPSEPEIVFYPKIKALAIQGHPEDMNNDSPTVIYINELINNLLG